MKVHGECLDCPYCYEDDYNDYGEYDPGYYCDVVGCPDEVQKKSKKKE